MHTITISCRALLPAALLLVASLPGCDSGPKADGGKAKADGGKAKADGGKADGGKAGAEGGKAGAEGGKAEGGEVKPEVVTKTDPWALPAPPPKDVYDGTLFAMSHAYPAEPVAPPNPAPWRTAIGDGPITVDNAEAYTLALKNYIAADMKVLLSDYDNWDAAKAGWYNVPWLTGVREPIHGTYVGSPFPAEMFPLSGLTTPITTHVLVYYDEVAATALQGVWGASGDDPEPGLNAGKAQYPEGSIIVKPAFNTADGSAWPPMKDALTWPIYASPGDTTDPPELQNVSFFQFDIIVKDTASSPDTQWVFTTLVYDQSIKGDFWDQMVPLGAMWGEDPDVMSPQGCDAIAGKCPTLSQTWVNPKAPLYAKETLGWGGRLSGPNDGAVDINAAVLQADGSIKAYDGRYAMSSCMSCHNAAQYPLESFLLPAPSTCKDDSCGPTVAVCDESGNCKEGGGPDARLVYYETGSTEFMQWETNRLGDQPMNEGTVSLDYGMNNAFKALPVWYQTDKEKPMKFAGPRSLYHGKPRPR